MLGSTTNRLASTRPGKSRTSRKLQAAMAGSGSDCFVSMGFAVCCCDMKDVATGTVRSEAAQERKASCRLTPSAVNPWAQLYAKHRMTVSYPPTLFCVQVFRLWLSVILACLTSQTSVAALHPPPSVGSRPSRTSCHISSAFLFILKLYFVRPHSPQLSASAGLHIYLCPSSLLSIFRPQHHNPIHTCSIHTHILALSFLPRPSNTTTTS